MKNIYMILIAFIFIIGIATAGIVAVSNPTKVSFKTEQPKASVHELGIFTFDCDGNPGTINGTEPYGKWEENEIKNLIRSNCTVGTISNIQKDDLYYQENKYGFKSFNVNELKSDECRKDGNYWNSTLNVCDDAPPVSLEEI